MHEEATYRSDDSEVPPSGVRRADPHRRPTIRLEEVTDEDVRRVQSDFWRKLTAARPRFGRLSGFRDFAVNLVRLFEMLVEPGFKLPWKTTAAIVFALAYFISSADLIPDAVPVLGFMDDAFVVAEVMVMVAADLARFEESRRARRRAPVARAA